MYPFAHKEVCKITINLKTKDETFDFILINDNLTGRTYIKYVVDSVDSMAAGASDTLQ